MFVSVNMDELMFIHKHADHALVSAISWLECPDATVVIENTDREFFLSKMSPLELRMLYRRTTGLDITGSDPLVVKEMLATIVDEKIAPTQARLDEVEAQVALVEDELYAGIPWKYAFGSRRPTKQEDLFGLHCSFLDPHETEQAAIRAPQRRKLPSAAPVAAPATHAPQRPTAARNRMSSVRPAIWAVADSMWQEAGSPTDKTVVLELRKKMMAYLETEKGIKKTSSSNELGNWMKDRLTLN